MIPRKLIGMEGRVQLTATPFAAERSYFEDVTQSFLREQQIYLRRKRSDRSTEPETLTPGRARGKRTRNGNQFSLGCNNSIFLKEKNAIFKFCPSLFKFYY